MTNNIEAMFFSGVLKDLKELTEQEVNTITTYVLEPTEYARRVGRLAALRDAEAIIENALDMYFPRN